MQKLLYSTCWHSYGTFLLITMRMSPIDASVNVICFVRNQLTLFHDDENIEFPKLSFLKMIISYHFNTRTQVFRMPKFPENSEWMLKILEISEIQVLMFFDTLLRTQQLNEICLPQIHQNDEFCFPGGSAPCDPRPQGKFIRYLSITHASSCHHHISMTASYA